MNKAIPIFQKIRCIAEMTAALINNFGGEINNYIDSNDSDEKLDENLKQYSTIDKFVVMFKVRAAPDDFLLNVRELDKKLKIGKRAKKALKNLKKYGDYNFNNYYFALDRRYWSKFNDSPFCNSKVNGVISGYVREFLRGQQYILIEIPFLILRKKQPSRECPRDGGDEK
jgi:hypothetical protein